MKCEKCGHVLVFGCYERNNPRYMAKCHNCKSSRLATIQEQEEVNEISKKTPMIQAIPDYHYDA